MSFVIVDTSVWIDFFRGTLKPKDKTAIISLLEAHQVAVPFIVKHEMLIGAAHEAEYTFLEKSFSALNELPFDESDFLKLPRLGYELKQKGFLAKYTDLIIVYLSLKTGHPIWSFDTYFAKLSKHRRTLRVFEVDTTTT